MPLRLVCLTFEAVYDVYGWYVWQLEQLESVRLRLLGRHAFTIQCAWRRHQRYKMVQAATRIQAGKSSLRCIDTPVNMKSHGGPHRLSCNVWVDSVLELKYPHFPTTWMVYKRSRFSWILCERSKLLVTWPFRVNGNVTFTLWHNLIT